MKLILHVGFHKTGTSAIQAFCKQNKQRLIEHGLLYPEVGLMDLAYTSTPTSEAGHRAFQDVLVTPLNQKSEEKLQQLMQEVEACGNIETVLISSETFSAPRVKISPSLLESLERYFSDIQILMYLRRQDLWADSFYKEVLCWPGKRYRRPLKIFINNFLPEWLDYRARIDKWSDIFGDQRLLVKSYDDREHKNIIVDFFAQFGLLLEGRDDLDFPGFNNPSLAQDLVPLMQHINQKKLTREQRSQVTNRIFNELAESNYRVPREDAISPRDRKGLKSSFQQMNQAICERFALRDCAQFCFERDPETSADEVTLTAEQQKAIKRMVSDLSHKTRDVYREQNTIEIDREDHGRVGVNCLLNEDPQQVKVFVSYHLALGVARIRLYFDNPNDPMADYDYGSDRVEVIKCDTEFWQQRLGRDPENNGEKLSTCHKHGLNELNQMDDLDWVINLDADELLYLRPGTTLASYLPAVPKRNLQVQVRPLEAIFVTEEDSRLFGARYFKVPRANLKGKRFPRGKGFGRMLNYSALWLGEKISAIGPLRSILLRRSPTICMFNAWKKADERLYQRHMPQLSKVMREGFLAHRLGRVFSRHGLVFDKVTSHRPELEGRAPRILTSNNSVFVLHYDAADFSAWHLKWHRRIYGETTASAIHDKRRMQQDMFKEANDQGEQAVKALFDSFFVFPEASLQQFMRAGLMVKLDLPLLAQARAEVEQRGS